MSSNHRRRSVGGVLALVLAVASTGLILSCDRVTSPRSIRPGESPLLARGRPAPDSFAFGIHWSGLELLQSNPGLAGPTLDYIKDSLGTTWVRFAIRWDDVEPDSFSFSVEDPASMHRQMVSMVKNRGLKLLVVLTGSSRIHRSATVANAAYAPDSAESFRRYVQRVVDTLSQVDAFAIWNEPDCDAGHLIVPDSLGGEAQQDSAYAALVQVAVPIIKAAGKQAVVGEFTMDGVCGTAGPNGADFVTSVFSKVDSNVRNNIDVFSVHAYKVPDNVVTFMENTVYDMMNGNPLFTGVQETWLTEVNSPGCGDMWADDDPHQGTFVQIVYDTVTSQQRRNTRWNRVFWWRAIPMIDTLTQANCRFHLIDTTGAGNTLTMREAARRYRWIRDGWPALIQYQTLQNGCGGWCVATDTGPAGVTSGVDDTFWEFQIKRTAYGKKLLAKACATVRYVGGAWSSHTVVCDADSSGTNPNPFGVFNNGGQRIMSVKAWVVPNSNVTLFEGLCQAGLTGGNQWDDPWSCGAIEAGWNHSPPGGLNAYIARIWPRDVTPCGAWEFLGSGPAHMGAGGCPPRW